MARVTRMTKRRLGELLEAEGLITEEQVRKGLEEQRKGNMFLGEALVKLGFVSEEKIAETIVQQFSLPFMSAQQCSVAVDVLNIFPERMYYEYQFIAVDKIAKTLIIIGAGLMNHDVLDELERLSGCKVCQFVSTWKDIRAAIEKYAKDMRKEQGDLSSLGSMLLDTTPEPAPLPKIGEPPRPAAPPAPAAPAIPPRPAAAAVARPPSQAPAQLPAAARPLSPGVVQMPKPGLSAVGLGVAAVAPIRSPAPAASALSSAGTAKPPPPSPVGAVARPPATTSAPSQRLSALTSVRIPGKTSAPGVAAVVPEDAAKPSSSQSGRNPAVPGKTGLLGLFKKP